MLRRLLSVVVASLLLVCSVAPAFAARSTMRTQALTTSYLGADLAVTDGTRRLELGLLSSGALVAGTVRFKDAAGTAVEFPIPAGNTWVEEFPRAMRATHFTFNVEAASGTPTLQIKET